jgi:pyridoxal phosphate enzyme (YggS family)
MIMDAIAPQRQDNLSDKLQVLAQRIAAAQQGTAPVCLIAVSKTQSADTVAQVAQVGQLDFGENYIQESVDKIIALKPLFPALVWHMIGPIQSNKTRLVAAHFDWVHTIERFKIAQRLSEQRPAHLPPLQALIQVNIDHEDSKSGVLPDEVFDLATALAALPQLQFRGLMCIPERANAESFQKMARLLGELQAQLPTTALDVLSMGMSADFESAIAHGATHVRVGSAIFGART